MSPLPRSALVSSYGHTTVTLSSANSFSYDKVKMTFQQYTDQHTGPQSVHTLGNGKLSYCKSSGIGRYNLQLCFQRRSTCSGITTTRSGLTSCRSTLPRPTPSPATPPHSPSASRGQAPACPSTHTGTIQYTASLSAVLRS